MRVAAAAAAGAFLFNNPLRTAMQIDARSLAFYALLLCALDAICAQHCAVGDLRSHKSARDKNGFYSSHERDSNVSIIYDDVLKHVTFYFL